jgi:hypothetical protein
LLESIPNNFVADKSNHETVFVELSNYNIELLFETDKLPIVPSFLDKIK